MRLKCAAVVLAAIALAAGGCVITLADEGKAGLYYSQTWEFGVLHHSQATGAEAESTWNYQPLVDYIVQLNKAGPKALPAIRQAIQPVPKKTRPITPVEEDDVEAAP